MHQLRRFVAIRGTININALRRFLAARGTININSLKRFLPIGGTWKTIHPDNGANFVAAEKELLNPQDGSPCGGAYERRIGSIRHVFKNFIFLARSYFYMDLARWDFYADLTGSDFYADLAGSDYYADLVF